MTTVTQVKLPMPRLGETMEQGTISTWLVKTGETFARGDPLLELETDKTLVEYPALGAGKLIEMLVGPGDVVDVGAPIAIIETAEAWDGIADSPASEEPAEKAPAASLPDTSSDADARPEAGQRRATPLARRLAREGGVDLSVLQGTGRRGRIEARDVRSAIEASTHTDTQPGTPVAAHANAAADSGPVLFIHGFAGLGSNWEKLRARLQKVGLKTEAPDMPGHGRNAAEANSVEECVAWLGDWLSAQDRPVHLVGHSFGAHVAALAANRTRSKVSRLTLVAPAGCGHDINGGFVHGMAHTRTAGELLHLLRLLGPEASRLPADAVGTMATELAKGRLQTLAGVIARGDTQLIDTIAALGALSEDVPVRAIFGSADSIIAKEHMFNMPPRVASHIVPTGHMPHWDDPALLESLIRGSN
ncbi:pyruvate dehydrogenase E2 component (dihydrolipoamide acetyltransferase) [Hoeflea halophila]|uniref:Pyruvate dehydrogenase E2 component (Dihydrolipoamide acetyltransferase) n=1 Tax=Hoeflea halophila TaxID=714899 RepID=A0A286I8V6_9HYPH|nr:alpha/beta fold hydrolase [Hoeflea halophila]SOE16558.1 pyruvate dehydrogenase E2 component (dihydrolipoamide acetyltransferase) [Hoeflea halophila]